MLGEGRGGIRSEIERVFLFSSYFFKLHSKTRGFMFRGGSSKFALPNDVSLILFLEVQTRQLILINSRDQREPSRVTTVAPEFYKTFIFDYVQIN